MADTMIASHDPPWNGNSSVEELEQRVQRLEDVVASLCDTQGMEDRLRSRLLEQLKTSAARPSIEPTSVAAAAPPLVIDMPPAFDSPASLPAPVSLPVLARAAGTLSLVGEMWSDVRTLLRMVRDPFYHLSWTARLVLALPLGYMLWSFLVWFPRGIALLGIPLDLALMFGLAYVVYKVFGRELARYRDFTAQWRR